MERFALGHKKGKSSEKTVKNTIFLRVKERRSKEQKSKLAKEQKSKIAKERKSQERKSEEQKSKFPTLMKFTC